MADIYFYECCKVIRSRGRARAKHASPIPATTVFNFRSTWKRGEDTTIACTLCQSPHYYYYCYVNRGSVPNCQKCSKWNHNTINKYRVELRREKDACIHLEHMWEVMLDCQVLRPIIINNNNFISDSLKCPIEMGSCTFSSPFFPNLNDCLSLFRIIAIHLLLPTCLINGKNLNCHIFFCYFILWFIEMWWNLSLSSLFARNFQFWCCSFLRRHFACPQNAEQFVSATTMYSSET